jgi:DNA-binding transcriptional regulator YdaS (Cro superfamily)
MKLNDYLNQIGEGRTKLQRCRQLAKLMGVSEHTVIKWANGQRRIKDGDKIRLEKVTDGQVKLRDMVRG